MPGYYSALFKAAQQETCGLIRAHLVIEAVIAVAGLLTGTLLAPDGLAKVLIAFASTAGPLLATVGLLFLWSLAWAPVNLARDDRKRIAELEELTSNKVETTFGFPVLSTLTAEEAAQLGLDDDIGVVIVIPNVSVINNSSVPVELEADLYVWSARHNASLLEPAEDAPIPSIDKILHRYHRRGGQLLSPIRLESKARNLGYLVFLFERQYTADIGIMQEGLNAIEKLQLELTNALTNRIVSTQEVPKTLDEFIERLDADTGDHQPQSI